MTNFFCFFFSTVIVIFIYFFHRFLHWIVLLTALALIKADFIPNPLGLQATKQKLNFNLNFHLTSDQTVNDDLIQITKKKTSKLLQPVLFKPMTVVNPTRTQYKILSYLDFNPLKHMLENFEQFTLKLLTHIQNTTENVATIEVLDALDSKTGYANLFQLLFAKASTQATELRDMYSHLCLQFLETLDYLKKPSKCQTNC